MKKALILLAGVILILALTKNESSQKIVIPKEAIRFRVIANSNTTKDQALKKTIVHNLNKDIAKLSLQPKNVALARKNIQASIPDIKNTIEKTLLEENSASTYTINYGMNYFPEKTYKGVVYEEGEYESLVVTLGEGQGENFWCILFPPLCLLEGEETESSDIEYTSFIKELINKYF